jgi:hypothetical protein
MVLIWNAIITFLYQQLQNGRLSDTSTPSKTKAYSNLNAEPSNLILPKPIPFNTSFPGSEGENPLAAQQTENQVTTSDLTTPSCPDTPYPNALSLSSDIHIVSGIERALEDEEMVIPKEVASAFRTTEEYLQNLSGTLDILKNEYVCICQFLIILQQMWKASDSLANAPS